MRCVVCILQAESYSTSRVVVVSSSFYTASFVFWGSKIYFGRKTAKGFSIFSVSGCCFLLLLLFYSDFDLIAAMPCFCSLENHLEFIIGVLLKQWNPNRYALLLTFLTKGKQLAPSKASCWIPKKVNTHKTFCFLLCFHNFICSPPPLTIIARTTRLQFQVGIFQ